MPDARAGKIAQFRAPAWRTLHSGVCTTHKNGAAQVQYGRIGYTRPFQEVRDG
jgi:hypothetical protein